MKPVLITLTVLALGCTVPLTGSADLKDINRAIVKQPKYASQPHYALLVFGREAKTRVWLASDGEVLYVDRNGNGDLTEANERVELDVEATNRINVRPGAYKGMNVFDIGEVSGVRLQLEFWVRDEGFDPKDELEIMKRVYQERQQNGWEVATLWRISQDGTRSQNPTVFCREPKDAQITHLSGPLTFTLRWGERQSLKRGLADNVFDVSIGTPCLATRNSRHPVFAPLTTSEVPAELHPLANFEFPHQNPGTPPLKLEMALDRRCCGDAFYGLVRVPAEAGPGKAKVVVSFPNWEQGKVASATFEIPIFETDEKR